MKLSQKIFFWGVCWSFNLHFQEITWFTFWPKFCISPNLDSGPLYHYVYFSTSILLRKVVFINCGYFLVSNERKSMLSFRVYYPLIENIKLSLWRSFNPNICYSPVQTRTSDWPIISTTKIGHLFIWISRVE